MPLPYDKYQIGPDVVTPLTVVAGAHAAGDVVGGLITVNKVLSTEWKGCELRAISLLNTANVAVPFTLYLFKQLPTVIADDAEFLIPSAEVLYMPPGHNGLSIAAGDYKDVEVVGPATVSLAAKNNVNVGIDLRGGSTPSTFYAYLVTPDGVTPGSTTDYTLMWHFWID